MRDLTMVSNNSTTIQLMEFIIPSIVFAISCFMCTRMKNLLVCGVIGSILYALFIWWALREEVGFDWQIVSACLFYIVVSVWVPVGIHTLIRWQSARRVR
jgi:hypothetical protein